MKSSPLGDGKTSFMRKQGTVDKKTSYTKPRLGKMARVDYGVAKKYGERAVEKYKKGKKKITTARTLKNKPQPDS